MIKYEIKFLDYWHLSSGLSAGSTLDSSVVKDKDGIAYIPGKTIKGLAREMAEELNDDDFVQECFGDEGIKAGKLHFSNATIKDDTKKQILEHALQDNLYDQIASTKINEDGIAENKTLREIEVVIPLTLEGYIDNIPDKHKENIKRSLKLIKRMGLNRNRGLGRCEVTTKESK